MPYRKLYKNFFNAVKPLTNTPKASTPKVNTPVVNTPVVNTQAKPPAKLQLPSQTQSSVYNFVNARPQITPQPRNVVNTSQNTNYGTQRNISTAINNESTALPQKASENYQQYAVLGRTSNTPIVVDGNQPPTQPPPKTKPPKQPPPVDQSKVNWKKLQPGTQAHTDYWKWYNSSVYDGKQMDPEKIRSHTAWNNTAADWWTRANNRKYAQRDYEQKVQQYQQKKQEYDNWQASMLEDARKNAWWAKGINPNDADKMIGTGPNGEKLWPSQNQASLNPDGSINTTGTVYNPDGTPVTKKASRSKRNTKNMKKRSIRKQQTPEEAHQAWLASVAEDERKNKWWALGIDPATRPAGSLPTESDWQASKDEDNRKNEWWALGIDPATRPAGARVSDPGMKDGIERDLRGMEWWKIGIDPMTRPPMSRPSDFADPINWQPEKPKKINTGGKGNTGNTGGKGNTGNTGGKGNAGGTGGTGGTGGVNNKSNSAYEDSWTDPNTGKKYTILRDSSNNKVLDAPFTSSNALKDGWAGSGGKFSIARYSPNAPTKLLKDPVTGKNVRFVFESPLQTQRRRFLEQGKLSGEVIRPPTKEEKEKAGGEIGTASGGISYMSPFNINAGKTRNSSTMKRDKKKSASVKKSITPTLENKNRIRHVIGGFAKRALKDLPNRAGPNMNKYFN